MLIPCPGVNRNLQNVVMDLVNLLVFSREKSCAEALVGIVQVGEDELHQLLHRPDDADALHGDDGNVLAVPLSCL